MARATWQHHLTPQRQAQAAVHGGGSRQRQGDCSHFSEALSLPLAHLHQVPAAEAKLATAGAALGGGSFQLTKGLCGLRGTVPPSSTFPGLPAGLRRVQRALPQHCTAVPARCGTHACLWPYPGACLELPEHMWLWLESQGHKCRVHNLCLSTSICSEGTPCSWLDVVPRCPLLLLLSLKSSCCSLPKPLVTGSSSMDLGLAYCTILLPVCCISLLVGSSW